MSGQGLNAPELSSLKNEDKIIGEVYRRIERERAIIQGSRSILVSTNNSFVQERCETSIREAEKNITYLEDVMKGLKLRKQEADGRASPDKPQSSAATAATAAAATDGSLGDKLPPIPLKGKLIFPNRLLRLLPLFVCCDYSGML